MKTVYRILRRTYAKQAFSGEGAFRYGGRWSSPGTRLVYTAEHLSLAMLEYFVHIEAANAPTDLILAKARIPDDISRIVIPARKLPRTWRAMPAPPELARIGDRFVRSGEAAILVVPSAIAPDEFNYLINPSHPDFSQIRQQKPVKFRYDTRMF